MNDERTRALRLMRDVPSVDPPDLAMDRPRANVPSSRTRRAIASVDAIKVEPFPWRVRWDRVGFVLAAAAAVVLFAVLVGGCTAAEDRQLVTKAAGVAMGDVREWAELSDVQRLRAHYKLARALLVLDQSLNDHEIPAEYVPLEPSREILERARR